MSKKQQTLFQSWANGTKLKTTPTKQDISRISEEITLDSDEDELLREALEESLKQHGVSDSIDAPSHDRKPTLVPSATPIESLPGFDYEAGSRWIYPTNYPVRKYQRDIVEACLFHNTLVSLPTGLGKTFIAAVVMYNFFRWYPEGKVIFLAPTKPLVAQQIEACYNIMGIPLETSSEMTGALAPDARKKEWREKRVFFLTPQVIANDISRGTCPVDRVKCLVLDEAHKALGNYAYVQVVNELSKHGAIFRVLALSATPGNDLKAIQQVISNLQISRIEMRSEDSPDILPYTHNRIVEKVVVPLGREVSAVRDTFLHILGSIARRLMQMNLLFTKDIGSLNKNAVLRAREIFRQNPPANMPKARSGMVEGDFALCISLTHALELLQLHGIRGFYNFLAGKTEPGGEGGQDSAYHARMRNELQKIPEFQRMMEELKPKICNNYISHPKLQKLLDIVLEHFQRCEKDKTPTRVMIFSQYRDSVEEIASLFKDHEPLIKAMSFVGHSSGKSKVKFTQADQLRVVQQFRDGNYNTLVATCVGEEGLDIGDVDLIVCYDAHKSPVRLVQRMGRTGRKRDGRIVMLMTEGKEEHIYNTSMLQKKNLLKNVVQGDKLKNHLSTASPRLIPKHIQPLCHEMPMTVRQKYPVPNARQKASSGVNVRKGKTTKSYYLSEEEAEYWNKHFRSDGPVAVLPETSVGTDLTEPTLKLDRWLPWQGSLQLTCTTGHSTLTQVLVEMMELISVQQEACDPSIYQAPSDLPDATLVERPISQHHIKEDEEVSMVMFDDINRSMIKDQAAWNRRGLYSPTFLQMFAFETQDDTLRPLNIPSPPSFDFRLSPDRPQLDKEADLSFPSFHITECKVQERQVKLSQVSSNHLTRNQAKDIDMNSFSSFQVFNDSQSFQIESSRHFPSSPKPIQQEACCDVKPSSSFHQEPELVSNQPDEPALSGMNPPIHVAESPRSPPPVANFDVDFDLSDLDIIPQTPPRPKKGKEERSSIIPSSPQMRTPPRTGAESDLKADPSPILSQRHGKKTFKRKLELVCSTPSALKDEKRVRMAEEDQEIPSSQHYWNYFGTESLKTESPRPQSSDIKPDEANKDQSPTNENLLSVSQIVHLMNSSSESEPESQESTDHVAFSIKPSNIQANFDIEIDFLERSPLPLSKTKPSEKKEPESPQITVANSPGDSKKPGFDHRSVWDDGFELSWNDIEEIDAVAAAASLPNPIESRDHREKEIDSGTAAPTASAIPDRKFVGEFDGSKWNQRSTWNKSMTLIASTGHSVPKIEVVDLDADDDGRNEAAHHSSPLKSESCTLQDDSPLVVRMKGKKNRGHPLLMTQSTPKAQDDTPIVTKKGRRRPKILAACSFIEDEASVSPDVTCSEDENEEHALKDVYEESFVDDQMASQLDTEEMRAVYLRSIKSPVAHQGFVFRQPNQRNMNYSDIYSQAVVEQDSDYQMDSFCVPNDYSEHFEESGLSQVEPQMEAEPATPQPKSKGRARKRIIAPSETSDSDDSPQRPTPAPVATNFSTSSSSPSPVLQRPTSNSFDLSREERLQKQRAKQEEFRRTRILMAAANTAGSMAPPEPSNNANRATGPVSILVSSRTLSSASEIINTLRVQGNCLPHVCSFDGADFVLSSQMGVIRKLHSDFANGAQRSKLQEQVKKLIAEFERPVLIVEADKPARDQWHRGNPSTTAADSGSVIFKSNPPYLYLTQAALAQTSVILLNTTSQKETAKVLSDLGRQESLKGFALPDAEKSTTNQKKMFEFLLKIPSINPAVALLLALRFNSLREIVTSSSETISRKCQITAARSRNIHRAFRIRLPHSLSNRNLACYLKFSLGNLKLGQGNQLSEKKTHNETEEKSFHSQPSDHSESI